ncbi:hypothetical protein TOPH_02094 [Tolypocladium ophioglossoides CBS 100239]|uniref:NACHT domain-containing protein n=1 Tax=Tolypocladium ophioglossoides (strain CBS 100239) TaxID=1163406 RepID=A0A0L0NG52_TOLOC|nr:hypothetical protein TOPH_02094 [Tolypocladium ophioglossoides CBS 100239]
MDPATAVGLAASVITFIDFSWSLVTGAKELHESGRGTTKENACIGTIVHDLKEYSLELGSGGQSASEHENALRALAGDCATLSEELVAVLEKLNSSGNSRWQSLEAAWLGMRKESAVQSIERRLGEYRAQMNVRLLSILNNQHSATKSRLDSILLEAEKMSSASAQGLQVLLDDLVSFLEEQQANCEDDSTSKPSDGDGDEENQDALFESLAEIKARVVKLQEAIGATERETRVLQHLHSGYISVREDSVNAASEGTFDWILDTDFEFERDFPASSATDLDSDSDISDAETLRGLNAVPGNGDGISASIPEAMKSRMDSSRKLFREWLTDECGGAFHISGKAGSGKSTMMKLIYNHAETTRCLRAWAGQRTLVTAMFFFWNPENQLQMSLDGLYRSILFLVLRQCPHLIPEVVPDQWSKMSSLSASLTLESDLFRPQKIKDAFELLMAKPVESDKFSFCFFVDGLDEHEAHPYDSKRLAVQLRDWARQSNLKICVSSRPHVEFLDTFSPSQRINLHELTAHDIYRFGRDVFENDENFSRVKDTYRELVDEVLDMAEGVFLWARLVFKSVVHEVGLHGSLERVRQTIRSTPREMDALYDRMLGSLDRADRLLADRMLLLILTNPFEDPVNAMCLAWLDDMDKPGFPSDSHIRHVRSETDVLQHIERTKRQVAGLTKELITLVPCSRLLNDQAPSGQYFAWRAQFFHQTMRDYLNTPARRSQFQSQFPGFDPYEVHSRLRTAEVALACRCAISSTDFARWWYGLEFLSIKGQPMLLSANPPNHLDLYQQSHESMELYKELCARYFRSRYVGWSIRTMPIVPLFEEPVSFLHLAAAHGQIGYLREEMGRGIAQLREASTAAPARPGSTQAQRTSLLFCASCSVFDPEMTALLLSGGLSTRFRVRLFDKDAAELDEAVSFWLIFVGFLTSCLTVLRETAPRVKHAFDILEQFLRAEAQEPVVIFLTCNYPKHAARFATLRELVLWRRPENTAQLLELLDRQRADEAGLTEIVSKVRPPQNTTRWDAAKRPDFAPPRKGEGLDHAPRLSMYAVASGSEALQGPDRYFRLW